MGKKTEEGLRILSLKIANLRNIEIIDVDFRNKMFVEIRGKNGSAKTSFIDGFFASMVGAKHFGKAPWRAIRQGQNKAMIKTVIGNADRQIEIKQSITKKIDDKGAISTGGTLTIKDTEGKDLDRAFLSGLLSEFTINPLAFAKRSAKDQIDIAKKLGGINTDKIEAAYEATFQERTSENRELKRLDALVKSLRCEPAEPVKMEELFAERQGIADYNILQDERERERNDCTEAIRSRRERIEELENEMVEMRTKLRVLQERKEDYLEYIKAADIRFKEAPKPEERKTFDAVDLAVASAGGVNEKAENWRQYQEAFKRQVHSKKTADDFTAKLKALEKERKDMILNSKFPFKNLEFDENVGILIDSIPFSQKSSAEQLRISTRLGMEMKPDLRILFIESGSLLDEESFEVVKEMGSRYGYQILVESVGEEAGENKIVLRAGSVVSAFERQDTVAEKVRKLDSNL